jgi:hypothetical protein
MVDAAGPRLWLVDDSSIVGLTSLVALGDNRCDRSRTSGRSTDYALSGERAACIVGEPLVLGPNDVDRGRKE